MKCTSRLGLLAILLAGALCACNPHYKEGYEPVYSAPYEKEGVLVSQDMGKSGGVVQPGQYLVFKDKQDTVFSFFADNNPAVLTLNEVVYYPMDTLKAIVQTDIISKKKKTGYIKILKVLECREGDFPRE